MRALLLLTLLIGCRDPYEEAKKVNTKEAWQAYLTEEPDSPHAAEAKEKIAGFDLAEVEKNPTLEAYDAFLAKYPKGKAHDKAMEARLPLLLAWAEATDTPDAWKKIVEEYNKADRKVMLQARRRMAIAADKDKIGLGPVTIAQVNLAGDPKGALDAWKFTADVTNKGDKPMTNLIVAINFLGADNKVLNTREWPAVAKRLPQNAPMKEGFDKPIAPGEVRPWEFILPTPPEGWNQQVTLRAAQVRWENPAAPAEDDAGEDDAGGAEQAAPAKAPTP